MDRVLLGAIFRKLPLKLLLVILACVAVFVACTKADDTGTVKGFTATRGSTTYYLNDYDSHSFTAGSNEIFIYSEFDHNVLVCFSCNGSLHTAYNNGTPWASEFAGLRNLCFVYEPGYQFYIWGGQNINCSYQVSELGYTSQQCQSEYNLIPINEVDAAYCQSNNLCSASGSPSDCPNVGVSNLFINDVFHPGAFNVIMNIPEEIDWDYAYTNSGSNINIDVVGYNQDTEYINGLIDVQNYQPTTDDFTKVFTNFGYFGGLLVACLFVILVFYFIKRLFK